MSNPNQSDLHVCPNCKSQLVIDLRSGKDDWYFCKQCQCHFEYWDVEPPTDREEVIFTECARCGKFAVHPDEWVDVCPMCLFWENLPSGEFE